MEFLGGKWEKPKYVAERKIPFIPLETEIDQLIAALSSLIACFCQILKETAARMGEAVRLQWTDIDFERHLITINNPEKGSNPRIVKVSPKCIEMLKRLPRAYGLKVFSGRLAVESNYYIQRKKSLINSMSHAY